MIYGNVEYEVTPCFTKTMPASLLSRRGNDLNNFEFGWDHSFFSIHMHVYNALEGDASNL